MFSSSSTSPTRWRAAVALIAPAVLVTVALLQLYRAHAQHLSPWKGGGFGMFSSINDRFVRFYLVSDSGEVLIEHRDLDNTLALRNLYHAPDAATLTGLAEQASRLSWALPIPGTAPPEEPPAVGGASALLPAGAADGAAVADAPGPAEVQVTRARRSTGREGAGPTYAFDTVRAEVWKVTYEAETGTVSAAPLLRVVVSRRL